MGPDTLLHEAWGQAKASPEYDKETFKMLQREIETLQKACAMLAGTLEGIRDAAIEVVGQTTKDLDFLEACARGDEKGQIVQWLRETGHSDAADAVEKDWPESDELQVSEGMAQQKGLE